jgi:proline iminopeptidase
MRHPLFPELQPFRNGRLEVSALHEIYWEECGNPSGKPAIVLHGGPGGGISPFLKRLHDPAIYRIVVFDQRGCGQSTPNGELLDNTTDALIGDIEALRKYLGIDRWQVVGGSWGSTLALAYAQSFPERVSELIVRGVFLGSAAEISWFYQEGASWIFPDVWANYIAPIPDAERHDLVAAHHRRLTGADISQQLASARAWSQWEGATISLLPDPQRVERFGEEKFATTFARIECHYFTNRCFLEEGQLLRGAAVLNDIPGVIVQGRYDVVTPVRSAYELSRRWTRARFEIVADAGHTATDPGIADALVRATREMVNA